MLIVVMMCLHLQLPNIHNKVRVLNQWVWGSVSKIGIKVRNEDHMGQNLRMERLLACSH